MNNPARNAYEIVRIKQLKACNRCGEKNLAWVKLASGKWALCHTSTERPVYTGQNKTPEAAPGTVYANKLRFHRCNETRMLDAYAALDNLKADCYRALNQDMFNKYGKNASAWPERAAIEMLRSMEAFEHALSAARQEVPKYY